MGAILLALFLAVFPACEVEDGTNCVWDAAESGNGVGWSFVNIGGTIYYFADMDPFTPKPPDCSINDCSGTN